MYMPQQQTDSKKRPMFLHMCLANRQTPNYVGSFCRNATRRGVRHAGQQSQAKAHAPAKLARTDKNRKNTSLRPDHVCSSMCDRPIGRTSVRPRCGLTETSSKRGDKGHKGGLRPAPNPRHTQAIAWAGRRRPRRRTIRRAVVAHKTQVHQVVWPFAATLLREAAQEQRTLPRVPGDIVVPPCEGQQTTCECKQLHSIQRRKCHLKAAPRRSATKKSTKNTNRR